MIGSEFRLATAYRSKVTQSVIRASGEMGNSVVGVWEVHSGIGRLMKV